MAIFRGVGGSGSSSDNSFLQEVTAQANSASASASAAQASATSAANSLAAIQDTEITSASFDTGNGVLTLTKTGGATVTADLDGRFLTSYTETNDLSTAVTWANVPDANITESSVTQHLTAANVTSPLTGGTGISIASNGTITNDSPDQTVALTGTGATTVTGTYPNFTIDSTNTTYTVGDGGLTTNDFTDADHAKLNGIEANATADQTGAEIKSAYEAVADTNAFTDAEKSKLSGIEASADVTDTTNVTAAGALMDSEVTNLAQVKAFDSSDYATAAQGSTADSALQNLVEDTTPQLGGDLSAETNDILNVGNISGAQLTIGNAGFSTLSDINLNSQDITSVGNISATGNLVTTAGSITTNSGNITANSGNIITGGNITVGGTVDGRDVATDGAKIDAIGRFSYGDANSKGVSGTTTYTMLTFSAPAPASGTVVRSINGSVQLRFYLQSSQTAPRNLTYRTYLEMQSTGSYGTSLGTATYSSTPSSYNAWYYVTGNKTDIISPYRGRIGTSSLGANYSSILGCYYDASSNRTYIRISKYPDAATAYANVEIFYSPTNFYASGTYVAPYLSNDNYMRLEAINYYDTRLQLFNETFPRTSSALYLRMRHRNTTGSTGVSIIAHNNQGYIEATP